MVTLSSYKALFHPYITLLWGATDMEGKPIFYWRLRQQGSVHTPHKAAHGQHPSHVTAMGDAVGTQHVC